MLSDYTSSMPRSRLVEGVLVNCRLRIGRNDCWLGLGICLALLELGYEVMAYASGATSSSDNMGP